LANTNAFRSFLKCKDEILLRIVAGRLFQARGPATEHNRSVIANAVCILGTSTRLALAELDDTKGIQVVKKLIQLFPKVFFEEAIWSD